MATPDTIRNISESSTVPLIIQSLLESSTSLPEATRQTLTSEVIHRDGAVSDVNFTSTVTESARTTLRYLLETSTAAFTSTVRSTMKFATTEQSLLFTSDPNLGPAADGSDVTTDGSLVTTSEPGFELSPMLKWFIATGTVIVLVIILIFINCCLSYREKLAKTVKDVKHYAAEEKRVRREQHQLNQYEEEKYKHPQTHVFWNWVDKGKGRKSPAEAKKQYSRC